MESPDCSEEVWVLVLGEVDLRLRVKQPETQEAINPPGRSDGQRSDPEVLLCPPAMPAPSAGLGVGVGQRPLW